MVEFVKIDQQFKIDKRANFRIGNSHKDYIV